MDDALLEQLSAYADGELDAAARARMEEALARDEGLRRTLDDFRTLDAATAALPVPQIDGSTGEVLWELVAGRTVHRGKEDGAAGLNERLQRELVLHRQAGETNPAKVVDNDGLARTEHFDALFVDAGMTEG